MLPPYVNAFCTSAASCARIWKAAPATNSAPKIAAPQTSIIGTNSSFPTVQLTSMWNSAHPSTRPPWVIRPRRRSANRSAPICASTGAGRTSSVSKEPSRMRAPSTSIEPRTRSEMPNAVADRP